MFTLKTIFQKAILCTKPRKGGMLDHIVHGHTEFLKNCIARCGHSEARPAAPRDVCGGDDRRFAAVALWDKDAAHEFGANPWLGGTLGLANNGAAQK